MDHVMRIRLQRRFLDDQLSLPTLKQYGVHAVRAPCYLPELLLRRIEEVKDELCYLESPARLLQVQLLYYLDGARGCFGGEIYKVKTNFNLPLKKDGQGYYKIKSRDSLRGCMISDFFWKRQTPGVVKCGT